MSRHAVLLLFALALMWGTSFTFTKAALAGFSPLTLVTARMALSLAVLLALLRVLGQRLPAPGRRWTDFLVMSLFSGVVPYFLIAWGMQRIDSGLAAILNSMTPLSTVVLAHFFSTDERMTPGALFGIALGFAGVVVLVGPDALAGLGAQVRGQLSVVGGVSCFSVAIVYARRNLQEVPPLVSAAGMQVWSTLLLVPLMLTLDAPWALRPGPYPLGALALLATVSTALPYLVYYRLLAIAGATRVVLVSYLIPLVGVFWGALLLGERLPWRALPALLLILGGIATVNGQWQPLLQRLRGGTE